MDTITYDDIMTIAVFSHVRCYGVLSEREATRRDIISDMADRKPWSTKRKMKERSAKLVAAKGARASTDSSRAAITKNLTLSQPPAQFQHSSARVSRSP
jgi:hypothetical protein